MTDAHFHLSDARTATCEGSNLSKKTDKPIPSDETFSATQLKLIFAAEKLFAISGLEGASLREIATQAGQRNHYAVQYHFGSREGLIDAVFAHRMSQMEAPRALMLKEAERKNKLQDLRTVLEMMFVPQLELQKVDGNRSYASFLCQFLLRQRPGEYGNFGVALPPNLQRIFELLRSCLTHLPDHLAQRRIVSGSLVFLSLLATYVDEYGSARPDGEDESESFSETLDDTLAQIMAAISVPSHNQDHAKQHTA